MVVSCSGFWGFGVKQVGSVEIPQEAFLAVLQVSKK